MNKWIHVDPQHFDKVLLARLFLLLLLVMLVFAFSGVNGKYADWVVRAAEGVLIALVAILRAGGRKTDGGNGNGHSGS